MIIDLSKKSYGDVVTKVNPSGTEKASGDEVQVTLSKNDMSVNKGIMREPHSV